MIGEPASEADHIRAVLEGVAFVERLGYERLAELGAFPHRSIVVTGGGSRSPVWNRIRATVLGMPLLAMPGAITAWGACMLAAAGSIHAGLIAMPMIPTVRGGATRPRRVGRHGRQLRPLPCRPRRPGLDPGGVVRPSRANVAAET